LSRASTGGFEAGLGECVRAARDRPNKKLEKQPHAQ
jgi:hypothetical protein